MAQGILPFQYKKERCRIGVTGLAGLPLYLELASAAKLQQLVERYFGHLGPLQGWSTVQHIFALVMLNLAGGDCVDDLERLNGDAGFSKLLRQAETFRLGRRRRRALERRWRKERLRSVPSPSSCRRFLNLFHNPDMEHERQDGKAFIPAPNEMLQPLVKVNAGVVGFAHDQQPEVTTATLDMDATLVKTTKQDALFCYKGFRSYQPLNTWWAELGMVLHSEFRDGNVPAGYQQLRVFQEALEQLPDGVKEVFLRSDSAGYQWDLLRYCATGENKKYGVIQFAVSCNVTPEFKKAAGEVPDSQWHRLDRQVGGLQVDTGQQWAEVCFVPNGQGFKKDGPVYRFLAIREAMPQQELPGMESTTAELPFPVMDFDNQRYKLFGLVTNRMIAADELIWWHRKRCGKSEEVHAVMKDDLSGGQLPSGLFGANAAWWQIMIIALNFNAVFKRLVLGKSWEPRRMKAIRYHVINLPGRVIVHANRLFLHVTDKCGSLDLLLRARKRILALATGPPV